MSLLVLVIQAYRLLLSPVLGPHCRYAPTCSQYALEALRTHGALHGLALTLRRVARCHPWGGAGYDPVPPVEQAPPAVQTLSPAPAPSAPTSASNLGPGDRNDAAAGSRS